MKKRTVGAPSNGFIQINICPFKENDLTFAECPEMALVARGATETEAVVNLLNMISASMAVAMVEGNFLSVIEKAGMKIVRELPSAGAQPPVRGFLWNLSVIGDARRWAMG